MHGFGRGPDSGRLEIRHKGSLACSPWFPSSMGRASPSSRSGPITWAEAWEVARPWFVDPDAKPFTQTSAHPGEWFQGEYDMVYRWSGTPKIVDLKASIGKGDRSGDYLDQLRMYLSLIHI